MKREMEETIVTDLARRQNYSAYLNLEKLLDFQQALSDPAHHDEMLFIIQHQVAELWMKLTIHELEAAIGWLDRDRVGRATKCLRRVKVIQKQLHNQWSVLETLTPSEYGEFRRVFGNASGFQSPQYRLLEILLGQRDRNMLAVYAHLPDWHQRLSTAIAAPSVYDAFLAWLHRQGHVIPDHLLSRDFSEERDVDRQVVKALCRIYESPSQHWKAYEVCETFVDMANNFQFWRFRHMKTVERIIGHQNGSGGSSGVAFLRRALRQEFFEELTAVRTELLKNTLADDVSGCPFSDSPP
ncbi:MAG: tryptophan 2,3-dioxygenase family protein [Pseudomonadota bacterium]